MFFVFYDAKIGIKFYPRNFFLCFLNISLNLQTINNQLLNKNELTKKKINRIRHINR